MDSWLYRVVRPIGWFFIKILYHPRIINKNYIPKKGPIIICGNHTSNLDCILLATCTRRTIHYLAKKELFKGFLKKVFMAFGAIEVDRKADSNICARKKAISLLNQKKVVGIFPEGTFNKTNDVILPFKMGAVSIAYHSKALIVPFAITGKYKIFGKSVTIEFEKPYSVSDNYEFENNKLMDIVKSIIIKRR